ncbi:MAG: response regulator transcription factor [Flavobacteriales bacterium]|nr:response regulator transcription factor [Flavobacteriales bacterium]
MSAEKINVLLAEDDPNLGMLLREYLNAKGYETALAENGKVAYEMFMQGGFDLCILDVMMPIKDGFTLAEDIRQTDKHVPIIFLTAKSMKDDKMKGFQSGADDYITKPFSMDELLMRMQAILRRTIPEVGKAKKKDTIKVGSFDFDFDKQLLILDGKEQRLTTKEANLLLMFCENRYDVLDRNYALNKVWGDDNYYNSRSMDVYIAKLRKYLSLDPDVELVNVHGKGFKLLAKE